ncbi:MAG: DUF883 C-terminal domain-containing protein [Pseudomonadota bacterium]
MPIGSKASTSAKSKINGAVDADANDINEQIEELKTQMASIVEHIGALGQSSKRKATVKGEKFLADGEEQVREMVDDAYLHLLELETKAGRAVRKNPVQTLGIAAGIGFLAGFLLRR